MSKVFENLSILHVSGLLNENLLLSLQEEKQNSDEEENVNEDDDDEDECSAKEEKSNDSDDEKICNMKSYYQISNERIMKIVSLVCTNFPREAFEKILMTFVFRYEMTRLRNILKRKTIRVTAPSTKG